MNADNLVSSFFSGVIATLFICVGAIFSYSDYKYPTQDPEPYRFTIEAYNGNVVHFYTEVSPRSSDQAVIHQLAILILSDVSISKVGRQCSFMLAQFDRWGENSKFSLWDVNKGQMIMCSSFLV